MAIDLRKDETIKRIQSSSRIKSKLFFNPISSADKNELTKWLKETAKGKAFVITIVE